MVNTIADFLTLIVFHGIPIGIIFALFRKHAYNIGFKMYFL